VSRRSGVVGRAARRLSAGDLADEVALDARNYDQTAFALDVAINLTVIHQPVDTVVATEYRVQPLRRHTEECAAEAPIYIRTYLLDEIVV
jgi:hypothetical protein